MDNRNDTLRWDAGDEFNPSVWRLSETSLCRTSKSRVVSVAKTPDDSTTYIPLNTEKYPSPYTQHMPTIHKMDKYMRRKYATNFHQAALSMN
jgi:hypothetical protein